MKAKILAAALAASCAACANHSTGANEVGVRVNKLTGIDDKVYPPGGTFFFLPFVNDWYTFSTKTVALEMVADPKGGDRASQDDIEFKTRDGNDVGIDVTVIYHIDPTRSVHILKMVATSDQDIKDKIVRPMARTLVRDALNDLSSEEIYTAKKFKAGQAAATALNTALQPYGVMCENVTLNKHRFHHKYQEAIDNKMNFDQEANTNHSKRESAQQEWAARLETVKGDVEQQIAQEQGSARKMQLAADAYFFARQKEAEGILAGKQNEAKGVIELSHAMAAAGGRTNVKLQIARALAGKKIIILPSGAGAAQMQHLDVNALIRTALAQEAVKPSATSGSSDTNSN